MIGEFQPKFDVRPKWVKDVNGVWQPDVDEATGLQRVQRIPLETYHQLFWPADESVSAISDETWFSITKGWSDAFNHVGGEYWFIGTDGGGPVYLEHNSFLIQPDWEWTAKLPAGTKKVTIRLDPHEHAVGYTFEVKAR